MKVYISGGITGVYDYMTKFEQTQIQLEEQGHEVINPAKILSYMPKSTTYEEYMKLCMALIDQCEMVYLMPDWNKSRGARFERSYGEVTGKIISYYEV